MFTIDDFPAPVPPIIPIVSPGIARNEMLLNEGAPAFLYVNDTLENSTAGILFSSVYNKLPDCISGFIANTASIRFPHAAAFVTVMIRFASFTSSTRICDI